MADISPEAPQPRSRPRDVVLDPEKAKAIRSRLVALVVTGCCVEDPSVCSAQELRTAVARIKRAELWAEFNQRRAVRRATPAETSTLRHAKRRVAKELQESFDALLRALRDADKGADVRDQLQKMPAALAVDRVSTVLDRAVMRGERRRSEPIPGRDWSPAKWPPWTPPTQTDEWRKLKSRLRIMERGERCAAHGVDEDGMKALEAEAARLQNSRDWRSHPGEAQAADVLAMRDIEWTQPTLEQILHDGPFGSGADPGRHYRAAGDSVVLNPAEIQARACRLLRANIKNQKGAGAEGGIIASGGGAQQTPKETEPVCTHSEDFVSCTWWGRPLPPFSSKQARAVEPLWLAWESGNVAVSEAYIAENFLDVEGGSADENGNTSRKFRLANTMRNQVTETRKGGKKRKKHVPHPAMGWMIHKAGKGLWRLGPPEA